VTYTRLVGTHILMWYMIIATITTPHRCSTTQKHGRRRGKIARERIKCYVLKQTQWIILTQELVQCGGFEKWSFAWGRKHVADGWLWLQCYFKLRRDCEQSCIKDGSECVDWYHNPVTLIRLVWSVMQMTIVRVLCCGKWHMLELPSIMLWCIDPLLGNDSVNTCGIQRAQ
jgi:hypothetical protein